MSVVPLSPGTSLKRSPSDAFTLSGSFTAADTAPRVACMRRPAPHDGDARSPRADPDPRWRRWPRSSASSLTCSLCGIGSLDQPCAMASDATELRRAGPTRRAPGLGHGAEIRAAEREAGRGGRWPRRAPAAAARSRRRRCDGARARVTGEVARDRAAMSAWQAQQHTRRAFINLVSPGGLQYSTGPLAMAAATAPRTRPSSAAVEHGDGPLLVLAGAGSGKTRVITHRIVRLLERGRAARGHRGAHLHQQGRRRDARARRRRCSARAGSATARALTVSTFHSFGLGVLQRERDGRRRDASPSSTRATRRRS